MNMASLGTSVLTALIPGLLASLLMSYYKMSPEIKEWFEINIK